MSNIIKDKDGSSPDIEIEGLAPVSGLDQKFGTNVQSGKRNL